MTFFALGILMYFLPAIIGHNKQNALGIFLVNFFLGWTIVGWVIALFWACTAETRMPVMVVAGPAGAHFCTNCGRPAISAAHFCSACGRPV
ncbi:MAG TPA: superinfection immunity protein [Candidatus Acidoferrales bacterium]|nr:superinfection immunity protein [Candidatus Acidoferrales bacterium]